MVGYFGDLSDLGGQTEGRQFIPNPRMDKIPRLVQFVRALNLKRPISLLGLPALNDYNEIINIQWTTM